MHKIIYFNNIDNKIKNDLKKELNIFISNSNINAKHFLIIGLGNDNYTADSIGPKTLKHIKANSYLKNIGIDFDKPVISLLEPGTLGETGILTERIVESISNEIKPDLVILVDAILSSNTKKLNKTIEINDIGLSTGMGIKGLNSNIDRNSLGLPLIVIGVPTAIEINFKEEKLPYILSTKDIDLYVDKLSKIIGEAIEEVINDL